MGRGLSRLQRYILVEAYSRRRVYSSEVLIGFFGWRPVRRVERHGPTKSVPNPEYKLADAIQNRSAAPPATVEVPRPADEVGMMAHPGWQYFSRLRIGEKRYRSVMASLSRACQRLEARGLVERVRGAYSQWSGVEITQAGREWVVANIVIETHEEQFIG